MPVSHLVFYIVCFYSARSYSFAEYWIHFMARFDGVHAFGYNSVWSEPIWMKLAHSEYIVFRWPRQILGAIGAEARARERGEISLFLWGKQRTISPTSRRPNFTKSPHKTWIGVAMNRFGTEFWKFSHRGSFFKKGQILSENLQRLATSGSYNSLTI